MTHDSVVVIIVYLLILDLNYRYDGLYKVVKYYKEEHKGFGMWKYLLRRDDIEPAPWTKEGAVFMDAMSVGHMEVR